MINYKIIFITALLFPVNIFAQDISGNWKWQYDNGKHITSLTFSNATTTDGNYLGNFVLFFMKEIK